MSPAQLMIVSTVSRRERRVAALARRGVAYHHAGLLPAHKEMVERLFTTGKIKALFATYPTLTGLGTTVGERM